MPPTPKSEIGTPGEVTQKFKDILKSNGIEDEVSEVVVGNPGLGNAGMATESQYVTVSFANPNLKSLNLFTKAPTSNATHTDLFTDWKVFEKEATFFTEYVPAAKQFCESKGQVDLMDIYPKCYYGDENLLVLENLVLDKGYTLLTQADQMDIDAAKLAITTLAKHHAISYAMIWELGGPEKFFQRFYNLDFEIFTRESAKNFLAPMFDNGINTNIKVLEKNNVEGKEETIDLLKGNIGKPYKLLLESVLYKPDEEKLLVMNHGDYHNNNMMYLKDTETNKLISHKAIDLQVTRYNSPAIDIGLYLYSSVNPDIRRTNLKELLKLYLVVLNETASSLDHPIELTYEELFYMYRRKMDYCFWMCLGTSGAGEALKGFDLKEMNDVSDISVQVDKLIQKWIDENPEKGEEISKNLVKLVNEYRELHIK